eukprot:TRINITY_DN15472_c0_g1_i1.p1 TRINITY_DN15472_c0_g1~~TRINITY_DN15472_c0_g1_i1.p1  ORF type:complete len:155 (-),score=40.22 TRINITY_DN15472_c0_g1_i1:139-603(-)
MSRNVHQRMAGRFDVDQRAQLFGSANRQRGPPDTSYGAQTREMIEKQNDSQIEDLEAKVHTLRDITRAIGKETKDSNSMLGNMSLDFDKASNLMNSTFGHLKVMMKNKGEWNMCYLVIFVFVLFFCMYCLRKFTFRIWGSSSGQIELVMNDTAS